MSRAMRGLIAFASVVGLLVGGAGGPVVAASGPVVAGAAKTFQATDLGSFGPYTSSRARGINDKNQIVGMAEDLFGLSHGVVWRPDGSMRDLGVDVYPEDINNQGTIVGARTIPNTEPIVIRKGVEVGLFDINGTAFKINEQEQILVKYRDDRNNRWVYYFRDTNGEVTEFPAGYGLNDLNDWGQVIGTYNLGGGQPASHAFIWQPGVGIVRDFGPASQGQLINNHGHYVRSDVVFCAGCPGDYEPRWYYYGAGGTKRKFIMDGFLSSPLAMNDKGQVVGRSGGFGGDQDAWFWGPNSGFVNLASRETLDEIAAWDINENTTIVGASDWRIVPEPPGPTFDPVTRATKWTP